MKELKKMKIMTSIVGVLMIVVGILFCIYPITSSYAAVKAIAALFVVSGIINIVGHFQYKNLEMLLNRNGFLIGILDIIMGIVMFKEETISILALSIMFSMYVFFAAIEMCEYSVAMKRAGVDGWLLTMIFSILLIIDAVVMIAFPGLAFGTMTFWVAFTMMFTGVSILVGVYKVSNAVTVHKANMQKVVNDVNNTLND